ncbi:YybH family protein [Sphingobium cloacae]|uniref:SnoaL-like domain-containing protein n=1 Tax=Sphingobium cloacae TaxID=120107 RepID=A0A1E1EYL8_9SPHN|nr:SgcJ/EcaC family oxidoreductase [Sphingobium cloacae]BAV63331.1 hypothetical protein SCLO_1002910 [Sphingobium cloacae]
MIASLVRACRHALSNDSAIPQIRREGAGLTRSGFLRVAAAGVLSAGIAVGAGRAFAAGSSGIAPVTDLDKFYDAWQDRFNAHDIEGMVDLYVADVTYINPEGKELIGKTGVRADFEGLFAMKPQIDLHDRKHIVYHDIALTTNHWTLKLTDAAGKAQELTGGGIEVVRKESDGGWRFIIDDASRSAS